MKKVAVNHDLDHLFDITPGRTMIEIPGSDTSESEIVGELVPSPSEEMAVELYDSKDNQIEGELDEVQRKAVEAYETMIVNAQTVQDKKYAPRNAEVAATFLQIALNALKEKNATKDRKDRIVASRRKTTPSTVNTTNNIVTDRETALKLLEQAKDD